MVGEIGGRFVGAGTVEIGYPVVPSCWGPGYATGAAGDLVVKGVGAREPRGSSGSLPTPRWTGRRTGGCWPRRASPATVRPSPPGGVCRVDRGYLHLQNPGSKALNVSFGPSCRPTTLHPLSHALRADPDRQCVSLKADREEGSATRCEDIRDLSRGTGVNRLTVISPCVTPSRTSSPIRGAVLEGAGLCAPSRHL